MLIIILPVKRIFGELRDWGMGIRENGTELFIRIETLDT